jgi:CDP-6-deoxy-D-xylo-4-hexulose-3-dehydrase
MKYPLALSSWDEKEIQAIHDVIESDMYTMGDKVKEFEIEFAKLLNTKYAIMVNSGSSANLLAAAAFSLRNEGQRLMPGDEVIVPAVSWPTTYYPFTQYGCHLKFVDIDKDTLNYDLEQLEQAVSSNTKLIVVVNLLGNANDFDKILELADRHDAIIFEDNCESLYAKYNGKFAGTIGLAGSYSGFFSHHISTMEGGLVTTDDEELYHLMLSLRAHGWTRNLPKNNKLVTKSDDPFEESFRFILPGYNLRPLEMSGAIGLEQIKKLPDFVKVRRENAVVFKNIMAKYPHLSTQKEIGESSWFGFSMLLNPELNLSNRVLGNFLLDKGIDCRPIVAGNFTKNPVLEHMSHSIFGKLNNANMIDKYGLFIGNHHVDMTEMLVYFDEVLSEFFTEIGVKNNNELSESALTL